MNKDTVVIRKAGDVVDAQRRDPSVASADQERHG